MSETTVGSPPITEKPSFAITPGMQALLDDGPSCLRIANAYEDFEAFLAQLQRDSSSEANMATVGPMLVALRKVGDLMHFVNLRGKAHDQTQKTNSKDTTP
jgi:hypothetical protein